MISNYVFDGVNDALPVLSDQLLLRGDEFGSRGGRTKELMHVGVSLRSPWRREIVIPHRKANLAAQIVETMWVLAGRNDVAGLEPYLPRAAEFTDDGVSWRAGYGPRLRSYPADGFAADVDQLAYVVRTMTESPGSRQAVATLWDPVVDTTPGKDIACNNWLSFSSRKGYLDLHVGVRSNDLIWGWSGINVFEWSALQEIVAGLAGLMVGYLHFSTTSLHVYDRHWEKARQLAGVEGNFLYTDSPRFEMPSAYRPGWDNLDALIAWWWDQEELIRTGQKADVFGFPEPMMRSWLRVLQWYWSGDETHLAPLRHTRLAHAALAGVAPAGKPQEVRETLAAARRASDRPSFLDRVNQIHAEKHAAYGNSWKRRGEMGILANIARKVDRLGTGAETSDETALDTAIDLLVYLAKYRCWLEDGEGSPDEVEKVLAGVEPKMPGLNPLDNLPDDFDFLCTLTATDQKVRLVDTMLTNAYALAESRYTR